MPLNAISSSRRKCCPTGTGTHYRNDSRTLQQFYRPRNAQAQAPAPRLLERDEIAAIGKPPLQQDQSRFEIAGKLRQGEVGIQLHAGILRVVRLSLLCSACTPPGRHMKTMHRSSRVFALILLLVGAGAHAADYDLVIRGGRVIDPETKLDAVRDVGITAGSIAAVSETPLKGKTTLDAKGLIVAPGFIDLHAHGQQLPGARMQAFDGVTTALEGEAGTLPVARFYDTIAKEGRPINYGATVSWAAARAAVLRSVNPSELPENLMDLFKSDEWTRLPVNDAQMKQMLGYVEQGLKEGAIGIGVLLAYSPKSGHKEFHRLNELAARENVGLFTHVRSGSTIEPDSSFEAYQEIVAASAATGAHSHIAHLNSTSGRDIAAAVELISGAQKQGVPITVEAYTYAAASTAIGAAFFKGENWQERLGSPSYADFSLNGKPLDKASFEKLQTEAPHTTIVFNYLRPDVRPEDQAFLDMSVLFPGGAVASDGVGWVQGGKLLQGDVWPLPADAYAHPRGAGNFTRLLRVYVREQKKLSFMEAIEKATLIPARILEASVPALKKKGRLQPGMDADIIVFDPETVTDRATFTQPAVPSAGMRYVIVNGMPVIKDEKLIRKALPGRPIRRS